MSVIDAEIYEAYDADRPSRLGELLARWPILTCIFLSAMFMLTSNDLTATTNWQEVSREHVRQMSINLESGRESRQIGFLALGVWGAIALALPASRRFRFSPILLFPILVFLGWSYLSVLWSVDRSFTIKRLIVFSCVVLAAFGFVKRYRLRDLALLALIGGVIQTVGNVVFDLINSPEKTGMAGYRLSGLQHPNHAGISAAFLAMAAIYFFDRTRLRRFLVILFVAVLVLLLTKSRSSLFACIAGLTTFTLLRWRLRTVAICAAGVGLAAAMLLMAASTGLLPDHWTNIIHMGREDAQATALTGRPMIWAAAIEVFGSDYARFLTGMGFDSFWTPLHAEYVSGRVLFRISEGHNGFFDLSLELGILGSGCFAFLLFGCLGRIGLLSWRERATQRAGIFAFAASVLAFTAVHCLTESTMVDPNFCAFILGTTILSLALHAPKPTDPAELA